MRVLRVALVDLLGVLAGSGLGLWTNTLTHDDCPGGLYSSCNNLPVSDFTTWQSALIGLAALIVVVGVSLGIDTASRSTHAALARWL